MKVIFHFFICSYILPILFLFNVTEFSNQIFVFVFTAVYEAVFFIKKLQEGEEFATPAPCIKSLLNLVPPSAFWSSSNLDGWEADQVQLGSQGWAPDDDDQQRIIQVSLVPGFYYLYVLHVISIMRTWTIAVIGKCNEQLMQNHYSGKSVKMFKCYFCFIFQRLQVSTSP